MTFYRMGTGDSTAAEYEGIRAIQRAFQGHRPLCPENLGDLSIDLTERLYALLATMWGKDPESRAQAIDVKPVLSNLIMRWDQESHKFPPGNHSKGLPNDHFSRECKKVVKGYSSDNPYTTISFLKSLDPLQRKIFIYQLCIAAFSNFSSEINKKRVDYLEQIFIPCHSQFPPPLFYNGLRASLPLRWNDSADRAKLIARILSVAGVSRRQVVLFTQHGGEFDRTLIEHWDSLHTAKVKK